MTPRIHIVTLSFLLATAAACTGSGVDIARDGSSPTDDTVDIPDGADGLDPGEDGHLDGDTAPAPGDSTDPGDPKVVRIVTPTDGAMLSGSVTIDLEPVGREERLVDQVTLKVNGAIVMRDTKLPTSFVLDTTGFATNRLELLAEV